MLGLRYGGVFKAFTMFFIGIVLLVLSVFVVWGWICCVRCCWCVEFRVSVLSGCLGWCLWCFADVVI